MKAFILELIASKEPIFHVEKIDERPQKVFGNISENQWQQKKTRFYKFIVKSR